MPVTYVVSDADEAVDYAETARLANAGFDGKSAKFSEKRVDYLYRRAFGGNTTIVSAMIDGAKIGQAVILWHEVNIGGQQIKSAQIIDLFVLPEHRSFKIVRGIYAKLNELLNAQPDTMIIAVPNTRSVKLNKRFLKLELREKMDIRFGLCMPQSTAKRVHSFWVEDDAPEEPLVELNKYLAVGENVEPAWSAKGMLARLSGGDHKFALHEGDGLLMVTSPRQFRGVPLFLICAIFTEPGYEFQTENLHRLLRSAAFLHRRPCYLYVGINSMLSQLPGYRVPEKYRPSPMQLQLREPQRHNSPVSFDRFEAIDFDFA